MNAHPHSDRIHNDAALAPTVAAAWARALARDPQARCLYTDDVVLTYAEVDAWSVRIAHRLAELGIAKGTHVVTQGENSAAYVTLMLALARLGAVWVPLDPTLSDGEFLETVGRSDSTAAVVPTERIAAVRGQIPAQLVEMDAVAGPAIAQEMSARLPTVELGPDEAWAIIYTSGSTSKPRGAVIPQCSFGITGTAMYDSYGLTSDDVIMSVLPWHHLSVTVMSFAVALAGGLPMALGRRFSRSRFFDFVRASGATVGITVPTIPEMLLTLEPAPDDRSHSLRLLVTHRRLPVFEERFGVRTPALWAMTETGGMGCMQWPDGDGAESVGHPFPPDTEVRLVDPLGALVPAGQPGEMQLRRHGAMLGYYGEEPPPDGWIASGDLFVHRDDGSFTYVGRSKNMIKRGGENISLEELERVLYEHPAVAEIAVIPVPDPVYDEEACAVVVWREEPEIADLRRFCRERLAAWKAPRYVYSWSGFLPELANHKLDRRAIKTAVRITEADDKNSAS